MVKHTLFDATGHVVHRRTNLVKRMFATQFWTICTIGFPGKPISWRQRVCEALSFAINRSDETTLPGISYSDIKSYQIIGNIKITETFVKSVLSCKHYLSLAAQR